MRLLALGGVTLATLAAAATAFSASTAPVLFDDFWYSSPSQLAAHGWIVRTRPGWPGATGATWRASDVTVSRGILTMTSSTDGTVAGTSQTQICQQRKFLAGTYASRVRFSDAPVSGPSGDEPVESFYTISPLRYPLDPNYSEIDFEYLPHGGWGDPRSVGYAAWETYSPAPHWIAVSTAHRQNRSLNGWHVLVLQVAHGTMTFFVDGRQVAELGGRYYPEVPMSINYNVWFIPGALAPTSAPRTYAEQVDWVYHVAGALLSPAQVTAAVTSYRSQHVSFQDTVPASGLASPCSL
ncbi:MAG TPA: glycoside hydrolase family 16 protein [Gaiellaceae bacterium]|nr:glycoside hydrolase family 16 protein [Gaiellaceae bacterium]